MSKFSNLKIKKEKKQNLYDVFISYAQENEAIVRQIYRDLIRHGLRVWEFKEKGKIGVDLEEEFEQQIEDSKYFCLIDSSLARKKEYVQMECHHAIHLKEKAGSPDMIICKVEKGNNWRKELEIFENQNKYTYIDFEDYEKGIKELFKFFSISYIPQFTLPQDKDFAEEMSHLNMYQSKFSSGDWQHLMDNYEKFRELYIINKKIAESYMTIVIYQSENHGIHLKTPYLVLGVLQAENRRHNEALSTFKDATQKFSNDPRFWAGLGGAQYYLSLYEDAMNSYIRCIELIKESKDDSHRTHIVEIVHNLEQSLSAMGEYQNGYINLKRQFSHLLVYPETQAVMGKISMNLGKLEESHNYFDNAYKKYKTKKKLMPQEKIFFCSLILDFAECYRKINMIRRDNNSLIKEERLLKSGIRMFPEDYEMLRRYALFLWETGDSKKAIYYLKKAIEFSHGQIKYRAELALIYSEIGNNRELRNQLEECFGLEKNHAIFTATDDYYLGLAYYLNSEHQIAKNKYNLSRQDKQLLSWPYYDRLISDKEINLTVPLKN